MADYTESGPVVSLLNAYGVRAYMIKTDVVRKRLKIQKKIDRNADMNVNLCQKKTFIHSEDEIHIGSDVQP